MKVADVALFQALLSKFREVRAELNRKFFEEDWYDNKTRVRIQMHIQGTVSLIMNQIVEDFL